MLEWKKKIVDCQSPMQNNYIDNSHCVISCQLAKSSHFFQSCLQRASTLSQAVFPKAANDSKAQRYASRLLQDALGGVLAEQGWLIYLNENFGNIASPTPFFSANGQIDVILNNGRKIEVRSSFPRNGVKFAICNQKFNFRVIGAYHNLYKPGETAKDLFVSVLFETQKDRLLEDEVINFSLIGGATANMLREKGYTSDLIAEGDMTQTKTSYRLLNIKDAMDMATIEQWILAQFS